MEQFMMKTKVYMGEDSLEAICELDIQKAYIICDPFMEQSGKIEMVTEQLVTKGVSFEVFSAVVPDPTIEVAAKAVKGISGMKPDTIIALGGGSAIDTAKAASYLYGTMNHQTAPRLIAIPTTSGTGSEVTSFAVISDSKALVKYPLRDSSMVPDVALLDPRLTVSVPPHITADTGMDVLTHALEAYVSTQADDFTDACAEKAIRLVWKYLERAVVNGEDMEARGHMHHASCLAGIAFNQASLGICHSMAHALGGHFHIPHGKSNAMLLPHVITYNAGLEESGESKALFRYAEIAEMLGIGGGTKKAVVHGLIRQIRGLMNKIGIPSYVTELEIQRDVYEDAVLSMAGKAIADQCTQTNPRIPKEDEIVILYKRLCKGGLL